jgi:hypothetical protein
VVLKMVRPAAFETTAITISAMQPLANLAIDWVRAFDVIPLPPRLRASNRILSIAFWPIGSSETPLKLGPG